MDKKFSIIIPSFNQGKFITNTIESIIRQEYENYEIIVVDGQSTDDTLEILKKYKKRLEGKFRFLYEKDKGFTDAVNKGLALATGDILSIQSSDDMYAPNAFTEIANIYKCQSPTLVAGEKIVVDKELNIIKHCKVGGKVNLPNLFADKIAIYQDATFFSREAFEKAGNLSLPGDYVADYGYWVKLLSFGDGVVVNKILSFYMRHENQRTELQALKFAEDYETMITEWMNTKLYENVKKVLPENFILAGVLQKKAYWYWRGGKIDEANSLVQQAIKVFPACKRWKGIQHLLYLTGGIKALIKYYGVSILISKLLKKIKMKFIKGKADYTSLPDPKKFLGIV